MAQVFPEITDKLLLWIGEQKMFFVASASLAADGSVNCSPKGLETFKIIGKREAIYLDMTGSGIETVAHVKENGRIVIMFCSFEGAPRIVRLHGKGTIYEKGSPEYHEYAQYFPELPGCRAIVHITLTRISDSCGYGVPLYEFKGQRETMPRWALQLGDDGIRKFQLEMNSSSIDGLPGLADGVG